MTSSKRIEVLAETSPSVWVTAHPTAKILGIARVHDLKPCQQILTNAAKWASVQ